MKISLRKTITHICVIVLLNSSQAQDVTTFAGGIWGFADGTSSSAEFLFPRGVCMDKTGNIYVADEWNHKIRKITPGGIVSTLAGSTVGYSDGIGTSAQFNYPNGVCSDTSGNIYVADCSNHKIRKITPAGVVTTLAGSGNYGYADGQGLSAEFALPIGICSDTLGNIYVADYYNHKIRKITPTGMVTTLAGDIQGYADGLSSVAQFNYPYGVCIDPAGNIFVADYGNHKIRKITSGGIVSTLAGSTMGYSDGIGTSAQFNFPRGVYSDTSGNIYVADQNNNKIRKITSSGMVSTVVGSTRGYADGVGMSALFDAPSGICLDTSGNIYIADAANHRIRKATSAGVVTTIAGRGSYTDGTGSSVQFWEPQGVCSDIYGNIYVADALNHRIRKITSAGMVSTFAGSTSGYADGVGTSAQFNYPSGVCSDTSGNIYVADMFNHRIRKITPGGVVTTLAGGVQGAIDGTGTSAQFNSPKGICIDSLGNIYVADMQNNRIRKITPAGVVTTIAGSTWGYADGLGLAAKFYFPTGVCLDSSGNIYVVDQQNSRIRKVTPAGMVTTFAGDSIVGYTDGTGLSAKFAYPTGICSDASGNMFIADSYNNKIRKLTLSGVVTTIAGNGMIGYIDSTGLYAKFYNPTGICLDTSGNIYVADNYNNIIRKITMCKLNTGVTQNTNILTADATGTTYQWLDCDNNYAIIPGETNQSFTATANGNYAVAITENSCIDTSACMSVNSLGINEIVSSFFVIHPNPSNGTLTIALDKNYSLAAVQVVDVLGKVVLAKEFRNEQNIKLTLNTQKGVYFVKINTNEGTESTTKVVVE